MQRCRHPLVSLVGCDHGTQTRVSINQQHVRYLKGILDEQSWLQPIIAFCSGENRWIADGWHRLEAYKLAGMDHVFVDIRQGTEKDAIEFALAANGTHGLIESAEDRVKRIRLALTTPGIMELSDAEIAEKCFVSRQTIWRHRQEIEAENAPEEKESDEPEIVTDCQRELSDIAIDIDSDILSMADGVELRQISDWAKWVLAKAKAKAAGKSFVGRKDTPEFVRDFIDESHAEDPASFLLEIWSKEKPQETTESPIREGETANEAEDMDATEEVKEESEDANTDAATEGGTDAVNDSDVRKLAKPYRETRKANKEFFRQLRALSTLPGMQFYTSRETWTEIEDREDELNRLIVGIMPKKVCSGCSGKGCSGCGNLGWVTTEKSGGH